MGAFEEGFTLHKQGKVSQAEELYIRGIEENPDNAQVYYFLGTLYLQSRRIGLAFPMFREAVMLQRDYFEVWNNLGNCYKAINRDDDARACWDQALAIPNRKEHEYADVYNNLATLYVNAGEPEKGKEYCNKAISIVKDHPDANWNLALCNLEMGNFAEGFDGYPWGYKTKNRQLRNYGDAIKDWDGSAGKTVVVWGEQGIGDELMFSNCIPDMIRKCKRVILDCHPRLVKIFQNSFPGVTVYGTRKDAYIDWVDREPKLTHKVAIGDLPKFFRRKLEDFPKHSGYLKADPERVEFYKKKLAKMGSKPKVGISWTGGYLKTRRDYRSINLLDWGPIFRNDVDFISLQYTPEAYNTVAEAEEEHDVRIYHWPKAVQGFDYHETAALVSALDLVITVNTSIHHLAGALGKECWTLTPKGKAWRYYSPSLSQIDIPWYPSVRQYQQTTLGEWGKIIGQVALDLKDKL